MPGRCPQCGAIKALEFTAKYADGTSENVCAGCGGDIYMKIGREEQVK
jgi:transcription elongation factor Elf1